MEIKKFDILEVELKDGIGREQGGIRPCVVIQNDIGNRYSPTCTVMLMTSKIKKENQPTHALIGASEAHGLKCDSMILAEHIYTIDKSRILYKRGKIINEDAMNRIGMAYIANFTGMQQRIPEAV